MPALDTPAGRRTVMTGMFIPVEATYRLTSVARAPDIASARATSVPRVSSNRHGQVDHYSVPASLIGGDVRAEGFRPKRIGDAVLIRCGGRAGGGERSTGLDTRGQPRRRSRRLDPAPGPARHRRPGRRRTRHPPLPALAPARQAHQPRPPPTVEDQPRLAMGRSVPD